MGYGRFCAPYYYAHHAMIVPGLLVGFLSIAAEDWPKTRVDEVAKREFVRVGDDTDVEQALLLLNRQEAEQMLVVTRPDEAVVGVITKADILRAIELKRQPSGPLRGRGGR